MLFFVKFFRIEKISFVRVLKVRFNSKIYGFKISELVFLFMLGCWLNFFFYVINYNFIKLFIGIY